MYNHEIEMQYIVTVRASIESTTTDIDAITNELDSQIRQESGLTEVNAMSIELSDIEVITSARLNAADYLESEEMLSA